MREKQVTFGEVRDLPKELYPELAVNILRSFNNKKYDRQQILDKFLPIEKKMRRYRAIKRHWSIINQKRENERMYVWDMISLVVDNLHIPEPQKRRGRPAANMADQIKFAILKVYNREAFQTQTSFNRLYADSGRTTKLLKRTTINNVFLNEKFTSYLEAIYQNIANYMIPFENSFAIDASGFSTKYNSRWVKVRFDYKKHREYKKLHIVCGVHTHIITEVKITKGTFADTLYLKELIESTGKRFNLKRVFADAGYLSKQNVKAIADLKAKPFIMIKRNTLIKSKGSYDWLRMVKEFYEKPEKWLENYRLRSNVECVFSMMKGTLLTGISSRNETSQKNELLIAVICHNMRVLVEAVFRFNIDPFLDG